jgi:hypothetical protein
MQLKQFADFAKYGNLRGAMRAANPHRPPSLSYGFRVTVMDTVTLFHFQRRTNAHVAMASPPSGARTDLIAGPVIKN